VGPGSHHDAQRAAVPGGSGGHPSRLLLVNVNRYHTGAEPEHQLKDSGAKAIVIVETSLPRWSRSANTPVKH
jgi:hypothetical protein